jgi:hypothetical protein
MLVHWLATALGLLAPQEPPAALEAFRNRNGTFQLELPAGWRQIAPNEAVAVREFAASPAALRLTQPHLFYAVGPVDEWLAGNFASPCLYVVEQRDEWYVDDDFAEQLRASWQRETETSGVAHELSDVRREKIGEQQVEVVVALRTSTPPQPEPRLMSLDVHVPTGNQQLTLSFVARPEQFAERLPEFRRWLATVTLASTPQEQPTVSDRLWTPLVTGAVVGVLLLLLYKHTRGRR